VLRYGTKATEQTQKVMKILGKTYAQKKWYCKPQRVPNFTDVIEGIDDNDSDVPNTIVLDIQQK